MLVAGVDRWGNASGDGSSDCLWRNRSRTIRVRGGGLRAGHFGYIVEE